MTYYADESTVAELLRQLGLPEQLQHRLGRDPALHGLRGIIADALQDMGRDREANLLRREGQHVITLPDGRVVPGRGSTTQATAAYHELINHLYETMGGYPDPELTEVGHDDGLFRPEDTHDPEGFQLPPAPGRARMVIPDLSGADLHSFEDVPHAEYPAWLAQFFESHDDGYGDWEMRTEEEEAQIAAMVDRIRSAPWEEEDPTVEYAQTNYGDADDLRAQALQNPWEGDIRLRMADAFAESGNEPEALFQEAVGRWLPERVRFGNNPTPLVVDGFLHGPHAPSEADPLMLRTWQQDDHLFGRGYGLVRNLLPSFTHSQSSTIPAWRRTSGMHLPHFANLEEYFALPRGAADSLHAIQTALPGYDYDDHVGRLLNDGEMAYLGLNHLDPDTDPAIWPQIEAILRERHRRGERFAEDADPTNYNLAEQRAFEEAILDDPYDANPRAVLADWLEERGDLRGAAANRRMAEILLSLNDGLAPFPRYGHTRAIGNRLEAREYRPEYDPSPVSGDQPRWFWTPSSDDEEFAEDDAEYMESEYPGITQADRWGLEWAFTSLTDKELAELNIPAGYSATNYTDLPGPRTFDEAPTPRPRQLRKKKPFLFGDDQDPLGYGVVDDANAFNESIRENPLELTNHLVFADWLGDQGWGEEETFRRAVASGLERRLQTPWSAPTVDNAGWLLPGAPHGVARDQWGRPDLPRLRTVGSTPTGGVINNLYPAIGTGDYHLSNLPEGVWGWELGNQFGFGGHNMHSLLDLGEGEDWNDWDHEEWRHSRAATDGWDLLNSEVLRPEERLWAGIDDWQNMDPALWPQVEALLRRQHGRGERLSEDEQPLNYGDREALEAQLRQDPRVSDVHLRLADLIAEEGDESEALFRQEVGRSLQRRFSQPWEAPTLDRHGFLHQGKPWMPEDEYAEHLTGNRFENGWGNYEPSRTHHTLWPALSDFQMNTQLLSSGGYGTPTGDRWIWEFAHENGGLLPDDKLEIPEHMNWPKTRGDLPTLDRWREQRWISPFAWIPTAETVGPHSHPHNMSSIERLFAGIDDPAGIDPDNWPALEALMQEMHSRGMKFEDDYAPTNYAMPGTLHAPPFRSIVREGFGDGMDDGYGPDDAWDQFGEQGQNEGWEEDGWQFDDGNFAAQPQLGTGGSFERPYPTGYADPEQRPNSLLDDAMGIVQQVTSPQQPQNALRPQGSSNTPTKPGGRARAQTSGDSGPVSQPQGMFDPVGRWVDPPTREDGGELTAEDWAKVQTPSRPAYGEGSFPRANPVSQGKFDVELDADGFPAAQSPAPVQPQQGGWTGAGGEPEYGPQPMGADDAELHDPMSDDEYNRELIVNGLPTQGRTWDEFMRRQGEQKQAQQPQPQAPPRARPVGGPGYEVVDEPHWTAEGYHPSWNPDYTGPTPKRADRDPTKSTGEGAWDWLTGYSNGNSPTMYGYPITKLTQFDHFEASHEEEDPDAQYARTNYGWDDDRAGFLSEVHANPLDVTGHLSHSDFLADQLGEEHPDVRFRRDLSKVLDARLNTPWVDKAVAIGGSGHPFDPSVRGFSPHNIPTVGVWTPEPANPLWGAGYTHTRLHPGWNATGAYLGEGDGFAGSGWMWNGRGADRHEGDPAAAGMLPENMWRQWVADRSGMEYPSQNNDDELAVFLNTLARDRSTRLTPAELGAFDFQDPESIDPAIWPQIEALLRGNWNRFEQFEDDAAPVNYEDESDPAMYASNPYRPWSKRNPGGFSDLPIGESLRAWTRGHHGMNLTWPPDKAGQQPGGWGNGNFLFNLIPRGNADMSVWLPTDKGVQRVVEDDDLMSLLQPQYLDWFWDPRERDPETGFGPPENWHQRSTFDLDRHIMRPLYPTEMFRSGMWEHPFGDYINDPKDANVREQFADFLDEEGFDWSPTFDHRSRLMTQENTDPVEWDLWQDRIARHRERNPMQYPTWAENERITAGRIRDMQQKGTGPFAPPKPQDPNYADEFGQPYEEDTDPTGYADFPTRMITDEPPLPRLRRKKKGGNYFGYADDAEPLDYSLPEQKAWLERIAQNWQDSNEHAVFADWLEEKGDPREAAFRRALGEWMLGGGQLGRTYNNNLTISENGVPYWFDMMRTENYIDALDQALLGNQPVEHLANLPVPNDPASPSWLTWNEISDAEDSFRENWNRANPTTASRYSHGAQIPAPVQARMREEALQQMTGENAWGTQAGANAQQLITQANSGWSGGSVWGDGGNDARYARQTNYGPDDWGNDFLRRNPLDTTALAVSADALEDQGDFEEAMFRRAADEYLRERLATGHQPPKVTERGRFVSPLESPYFIQTARPDRFTPGRWETPRLVPGVFHSDMIGEGLSQEAYPWWQENPFDDDYYETAAPDQLRDRFGLAPGVDLEEFLARARASGQTWDWHNPNAGADRHRDLSPLERLYTGWDDLAGANPDQYLEVLNLMRRRRAELGHFADDDEPTPYAKLPKDHYGNLEGVMQESPRGSFDRGNWGPPRDNLNPAFYSDPTDHDFLNKILENPQEATAAMVYADWLDEQGRHGLAKTIRRHVELFGDGGRHERIGYPNNEHEWHLHGGRSFWPENDQWRVDAEWTSPPIDRMYLDEETNMMENHPTYDHLRWIAQWPESDTSHQVAHELLNQGFEPFGGSYWQHGYTAHMGQHADSADRIFDQGPPRMDPDRLSRSTMYGDRELLHGAMLQNPWESDLHLRLADLEAEEGNEAEAMFREKVGRWLPGRMQNPPDVTTDHHGERVRWMGHPADFLHISALEPGYNRNPGWRSLAPEARGSSGANLRWTTQDAGSPAFPEQLAERLGVSRDEALSLDALRNRPDLWYSPHHVSRVVNPGERAYLGFAPEQDYWITDPSAISPDTDPDLWPQIEALLRQRHRMKKDFADDDRPTPYAKGPVHTIPAGFETREDFDNYVMTLARFGMKGPEIQKLTGAARYPVAEAFKRIPVDQRPRKNANGGGNDQTRDVHQTTGEYVYPFDPALLEWHDPRQIADDQSEFDRIEASREGGDTFAEAGAKEELSPTTALRRLAGIRRWGDSPRPTLTDLRRMVHEQEGVPILPIQSMSSMLEDDDDPTAYAVGPDGLSGMNPAQLFDFLVNTRGIDPRRAAQFAGLGQGFDPNAGMDIGAFGGDLGTQGDFGAFPGGGMLPVDLNLDEEPVYYPPNVLDEEPLRYNPWC